MNCARSDSSVAKSLPAPMAGLLLPRRTTGLRSGGTCSGRCDVRFSQSCVQVALAFD